MDMDELDTELKYTKGCFGIDVVTMSGDSAAPVVNSDFKLLGLVRSTIGGLGYVNKIEHYLEYLK